MLGKFTEAGEHRIKFALAAIGEQGGDSLRWREGAASFTTAAAFGIAARPGLAMLGVLAEWLAAGRD